MIRRMMVMKIRKNKIEKEENRTRIAVLLTSSYLEV